MNGSHDGDDDGDDDRSFVASDAWNGSRAGYYFGTGPRGTGYYLDSINQQQQKRKAGNQPTGNHQHVRVRGGEATESAPAAPPKKRARPRTVLFDDDRNTTLEYEPPPRHRNENDENENDDDGDAARRRGQQQLEEAERRAASSNRILVADATPKGIRAALRRLRKAHEDNAVMRAEHGDDPALYMDSEINLYEHIQGLKSLAADPATSYPVIVGREESSTSRGGGGSGAEGEGWETLGELLGHPNPDVVASVINLLLEWLDPSLIMGEGPPGGDNVTQRQNDAVLDLARCAVRDVLETIVAQHLVPRAHGGENDGVDGDPGNGKGNRSGSSSRGGGDDEEEEDDEVGKGVDDILSLLENLLEIDQFVQSSSSAAVAADPAGAAKPTPSLVPDGSSSSLAALLCRYGTLHWLFRQIHEATRFHDRALELLVLLAARDDVYAVVPDWSHIGTSIAQHLSSNGPLLQPAKIPDEDEEDNASTLDGMELLLQTTARFRKRHPVDEAELSVLENTCMVMSAALLYSPRNLTAFVERQGVELVLRCLQERVHAGGLALKWLDVGTLPSAAAAAAGAASNENGTIGDAAPIQNNGTEEARRAFCEHMVKAGAFKYLFPMLMGRHAPKAAPIALVASKRAKREWGASLEATVISIMYCLTVHLTDDSPCDAKQRFVAKFVEEEKCDRLVELCLRYDHRARKAEFDFYRDVEEAIDPDLAPVAALAAKLEGGGDVLHRACAVAAFCCVESRRCHERILSQLKLQQSGITMVRDALQEFAANLEVGAPQRAQLEAYLERL